MIANIDVDVKSHGSKLVIPARINPFKENARDVIVFRSIRSTVKAMLDPNVNLDKYYGTTPTKAYLYSQKVDEKGLIQFDLIAEGEAHSLNGVVKFDSKYKIKLPELPLVIVPDKARRRYREEVKASLVAKDVLDNEALVLKKLKKSPQGQYLLACKDIIDELKEEKASIGRSFMQGTQIALVNISDDSPHVLCYGVVHLSRNDEVSFNWQLWTQRMGKETKRIIESIRHNGDYHRVVAVPIAFLQRRLGIDIPL